MKSKVILFCVLLFCSIIVDSIPHSENHVRQSANPLSNWQVNKKVPNAQYLDTDNTQPRNVNKLTNSAIQQENNEDYYSNQRVYNYDGYKKGPASSPSANELLVDYESPADGRRLDSYPPRVESYPSHSSQVGFDHQPYRNQKWRSQNPFANSVPSSVFIPNDERPLVTSVQEPYQGLAHSRRPHQPGRSYLTREQLQYPSADHSGVNKYVMNPVTRFGSGSLVPYDNYSESQASETKTRPTGIRKHVQNSEMNYEIPAVESVDTLVDQSKNIRYPVPYENYREGQVSETKTRLTGIPKHVQNSEINYEAHAGESPDTLVDQNENRRYPVPYKNYREGQASDTKTRLTGFRGNVQNSEINYETPAVESPVTLVDQSESIRYPVPYENYREDQVSETKSRLTGVRRHIQNFKSPSEVNYETHAINSPDTLVDQSENIRYPVPYENYREGQVSETKTRLTRIPKHVQNSEINYETPAVESPVTLVDQSENIKYPVPYENYRKGEVSETKSRLTEVRRHLKDFETPSEINYETHAGESPDTLVDQSENRRYPVPYDSYSESGASEKKTRPTGIYKHVQNSEINYKTPAVESIDTLLDQSKNIRYRVPYENDREGQVSETKTRLTGTPKHVQRSEIKYETTALESPVTLVDQSENIRYPVPYENYREGEVSETKSRLTEVRRHIKDFETPSEINYEIHAGESPDTLVDQSENRRYPVPYKNYREGQVSDTKTRLTEVHRHVKDFETPSEIIYETHAIESPDTNQFENIRYVEHSRSGPHLSNSAPITSHDDGSPVIYETDTYSSDSRPSKIVPIVNVKKEAIVEIRKKIADKPLARKYAHRSDYGSSNIARDNSNSDASTDITETIDIEESKYGANYAEEQAVPIDTYPEDSLIPTNTVLENSGSHTYEESNVPHYGSSIPNNSKQNIIHHLTSEIKEMSLKSLVANPEIQHILSRTDKRYVVVHSNGTIEYLDTLPLDSQQDSKLRLVHTKRKNIDGSEGDGVLTPQLPQNLPSNIAKTPAPVDEYSWATNNQPADEYDSNAFENLPAGHSHLKPLPPHEEQPAEKENSKLLPPPINRSADGLGYSKPLIPYEDRPVDNSKSNQPKDDDNSKSLAPNEAEPEYDANPKPTPANQSGDDDNSNPLPRDVNHPTGDDSLKHWTSPENQPRDDDSSKPLLADANQSKDKINLTPYARNPEIYVTHPANDNTFKFLPPVEAQPRDDRNSEPAHLTKPKHSNGNQPENDNNSNPSSSNKNQPTNDINSELLNKNLSGDDSVPKLLHPYYIHHKKSKHSQVNGPADGNNSNPSSTPKSLGYPKNQPRDDNPAKPLSSNENQSGYNKNPKPSDTNENQTDDDNDSEPLPSHNRHPEHRHKSKHFYGTFLNEGDENQQGDDISGKPLPSNEDDKPPEDDKSSKPQKLNENQSEGDIDFEPLSPHKKPRAQPNKAKPKHSGKNQESDDNNSYPLSQDKNQPGDNNAVEPLPSNDDQSEVETDSTPKLLHKKLGAHHKKSKHHTITTHINQPAYDDYSKLLPSPVNQPEEDNNPNSPKPSHSNEPVDDNNSKQPPSDENHPEDDKNSKLSKPLPGNEPADDNNIKSSSSYKNQPAGDKTPKQSADETESTPSLHKKKRPHRNKSQSKDSRLNQPADDDDSPETQPEDKISETTQSKHSRKHQPANDSTSKPLALIENDISPDNKQPENDDSSKPFPKPFKAFSPENQSANDNDSKPLPPNKSRPVHHNKSKHSKVNKPTNANNSNPVSPERNQVAEDNGSKPLPSNANQPKDETDSTLSLSHKKQPAHQKKPKHSHVDLELEDHIANPSSQDKNQPGDNNTAEPLPSNADQSEVETDSTPTLPHKKSGPHHKKSKHHTINTHINQPAYDDNSKLLPSPVNQPEEDNNPNSPKPSHNNEPADDNNSKQPPSDENLPEDDKNSKLSKPLPGNEPADDNNIKSPISYKNQPAGDKTPKQSADETESTPSLHKKKQPHRNKSQSKDSRLNQPADDDDSPETQPEDKISEPLPAQTTQSKHSRKHQPANDSTSKPPASIENDISPDNKQPENDDSSKPFAKPFKAFSPENQSADDNDSKPLPPNKSRPVHHNKSKHSKVNKPTNANNSNPASPERNQVAEDNGSKPLPSNANQPKDKTDSTQSLSHKKQPAHHKKPKHSYVDLELEDHIANPSSQDKNQPGDNNTAEPLPSKDDQSEVETDSTPTLPHKKSGPHHKKSKHHTINTHINQPAYDDNSKLLPSPVNQPEEDNNPNSPKPSHNNEPADDNNSKQPSSDENHPEDDKNSKLSKPLPGNEPADDKTPKQSADETESTPSLHKKKRPHRNKSQLKDSRLNQPADDDDSPETQPEDKISEPLPAQTTQSKHSRNHQPANYSTSKPPASIENDISPDKQLESDDSLKPFPKPLETLSPENPSADDNDSKPLPPNKRRPVHRNKSKHSKVNKPANDNNSNPAFPERNQLAEDNGSKPLPSNANQLKDETDFTPSLSHKKQPAHHKKPKHSHADLESEDNIANPSSQDGNQQTDDKAHENQSGDEIVTTVVTLPPHIKQRVHHKKPKDSRVNKSVDDYNSKKSPDETENLSTNDNNNSKPSPPEDNQLENDIKSKPTPSVSSKNDDESKSTTLSPTVPSYTTTPKPEAINKYKRKHSHRKTKTNSPVVSTTPSLDDSSEDQIITLSPIEQVTDNVSDVPTLTSTTAKPVETSDKKYIYKDSDNKPDEAQDDTKSSFEDLSSISDKVQTPTTTVTPSSSTSPTDNASDDKTKGKSEEYEDKAVISKENNGKDSTQTAAYNSSELLNTNTDVQEETDDYSPVTLSPSVQNDVYTGDASGDNSSELEQSETDVTITVSSSTACDSEDEIITINIDVSESTDNADSPSNNKTLVVNIDTNPDDDDDSKALQTDVSKTPKTEDCKDDHNHDDDRGKNVEFDFSNLKEPTMWIKTTNQDFIDELIAKNDTQFDMIYFFSIENQPIIEREKETTIFCNGTVVVETTEITYAHKDDLTPTIIKTTEIMQIEDYELYK